MSVGSGVAASAGTSGALALFGSGAGVAGYKGVTGSQARSAAARAEGMATKKIKVKCPSVGCVHEQRIEVPLDQNLSGSSWECVECGRRFEVRIFGRNLGKFDRVLGIFCDILAYLTDIFGRGWW